MLILSYYDKGALNPNFLEKSNKLKILYLAKVALKVWES